MAIFNSYVKLPEGNHHNMFDLLTEVDDFGMPIIDSKLQSPFSRSDTLEEAFGSVAGGNTSTYSGPPEG